MKLDERAAALAKACDWTYEPELAQMVAVDDGDIVVYEWPSLDAMHAAAMTLSDEEKLNYRFHLKMTCGTYQEAIDANSQQREEAFLRTKGFLE